MPIIAELWGIREILQQTLTPTDRRVLACVLGFDNNRLDMYVSIARIRSDYSLGTKEIEITPYLVSLALCEDLDVIERSFERISNVLHTRRTPDNS